MNSLDSHIFGVPLTFLRILNKLVIIPTIAAIEMKQETVEIDDMLFENSIYFIFQYNKRLL